VHEGDGAEAGVRRLLANVDNIIFQSLTLDHKPVMIVE
jgi:acyl dehydratase